MHPKTKCQKSNMSEESDFLIEFFSNFCVMENLASKGPPMKNLVCNEKFGINCASAETQFGTGRSIRGGQNNGFGRTKSV